MFLPIPVPEGMGDTHSLPGGRSPVASAHSTAWGSGKWQRNPVRLGSPETLQGTRSCDEVHAVPITAPNPSRRPRLSPGR